MAAEVPMHGWRHHTPEGCEGGGIWWDGVCMLLCCWALGPGAYTFLPTPLQIGGKPPYFPPFRVYGKPINSHLKGFLAIKA